jgi:SAM-dependent methyltransferase
MSRDSRHQEYYETIFRELYVPQLRRLLGFFRGAFLEVGCGDKVYFDEINPKVDLYIGLDYPATAQVSTIKNQAADVFGDGRCLPFKNAVFDTFAAFAVLEHVENVDAFLNEAHRVLKPGGHIILTTPHAFQVHGQPYDYLRFTSYGIVNLLRRHGFQTLEMYLQGGPAYHLYTTLNIDARFRLPCLTRNLQRLVIAFDRIFPHPRQPVMNLVVAESKPADQPVEPVSLKLDICNTRPRRAFNLALSCFLFILTPLWWMLAVILSRLKTDDYSLMNLVKKQDSELP